MNSTPKWMQDYVDACNRHDAAAVVAMMADDVEVVDTAFGGIFTGRDAVQQLIAGMDAALSSNFRFQIKMAVESGDSYAFEWVLSGTHDRANPALGIPATGKEFAVPGLTIGTRRDGGIVKNRDYWNVAGFLMQVGLMSAPGQTSTSTQDVGDE